MKHVAGEVFLVALLAPGLAAQQIVVRRPPELPAEVVAWRASLREGRPALRGFRAPILDRRDEIVPIDLPEDPVLRAVAAGVARRLAVDGILATTSAAVEALTKAGVEVDARSLRAVGLPVDWLAFFRGPAGEPAAARLDVLHGDPSEYTFEFRPSVDGFLVATESGEHEIGLVRLQLPSGDYWTGEGDGGGIDVLRQLLAVLPDADFVASVEEKHLERLLETARAWPIGREGRLTLVPEKLPVAQWAQDNGKPGTAPAADGTGREPVTLAPRYASRGEDGAAFVPGETFLLDGFASAGSRVVQSPLLFQGGDLLAVRDPRSGERVLLIGEANVWRNTALGLSQAQVLAAFRIELGVDRCLVLPAVSFHLDQELTIRAAGDRLVAFVADPVAAVRIVIRCGLEALGAAGVLSSDQAASARKALEAGSDREVLDLLAPAIADRCPGFGRYPESLARSFARGGADSGVGNLHRFLIALDLLASWTLPVDELALDPHSIAYLRSFRRRDEDRRAMVADLAREGFEIVPVPSLPEGNRGIDGLNGVHEARRGLVPAWGGLYEPLDLAAESALRERLGPAIAIHRILTGESQRRGGALHCAISAIPKP